MVRRGDVWFVLAWFAATRVLAARAGITHEFFGIDYLWQLAPVHLLKSHYFETLWFLHGQPPLYNALVGGLLQLPGNPESWLHACWIVVGLTMVLVVLHTLVNAGYSRRAAHVATLVFALNPSLLLYENFAFYSYPEALGALGGLVGYSMLLRRPRIGVAVAALIRLAEKKRGHFGRDRLGFDHLSLILFYDRALLYNSPVETLDFTFEDRQGSRVTSSAVIRDRSIVRSFSTQPRSGCSKSIRPEYREMPTTPHPLDVVALLSEVPALGLRRGQVGTVVEFLAAPAKSNSQTTKEKPTRSWLSRPISYWSFTTAGTKCLALDESAKSDRQVGDSIRPFFRVCCCPNENQVVGGFSQRQMLRNDDHAGAAL